MSTPWKSALAAGVMIASVAGTATAVEEEGFYVGGSGYYTNVVDADTSSSATVNGGGGGNFLSDLLTTLGLLPPAGGGGAATTVFSESEISFEEDSGYGARIGYKFKSPLRFDLEYRVFENDVEKTDSSLEIESLMGNLWFDFNPGEQLRPYVGFGLGLANASLSELEQEEVLIGQLGAGATYYLTHRLALDAGYRYTMSEDLEFTSGSAKFETEYSAHSVMLGLRYGFYDAIYGIQDTDGDGVADETDQCPGTPRGVQVDSVGCPLDGDGDGVADYLDQCPNTPAGTPVNEQGCVADNDNDGVADFRDACPDTAAGEEVMTNGCARDQAVVLRGVNFETNSAQLTVNAETILDSVGETLNTSPGFSVELQGHTDSVGADSYNMNLSQNRARAVKNYLVDQGVDSARLSASGYGEESPIADNDTSEGRAENRRVTLKVLASGDEEAVMEDAVDEFAAEEDAMEEAEEAMEEEAEAIEEAVEEEAEAYEDDMEDDFDEELEY